MQPRQQVEVTLDGVHENKVLQFTGVTDIRIEQRSLLIVYDGNEGPEQIIFAPDWWVSVRSKADDQGAGHG